MFVLRSTDDEGKGMLEAWPSGVETFADTDEDVVPKRLKWNVT